MKEITTESLNQCSQMGGFIAINRKDKSIMFAHINKKDLTDMVKEYCLQNVGEGFNVYQGIGVLASEITIKESEPKDFVPEQNYKQE